MTSFALGLLAIVACIYSGITAVPDKILKGKIAVVTGATRGIGKGIAKGLAEAGAIVYVTGRSDGKSTDESLGGNIDQTVKEIEKLGGIGIGVKVDHKNDEEVKYLFEKVEKDYGRLDILVNNAFQLPMNKSGKYDIDNLFQGFWEQGPEFYDSLMDVGLRSHYVASVYAVPLLRKTQLKSEQPPTIFHISSFGGVSYSFNVAYGVGKAAVDRLAKDMAKDLKPIGINSFSIYPGVVSTERMSNILKSGEFQKFTGLVVPEPFVESPILTGRVIAAIYAKYNKEIKLKPGQICVVAELAKKLGVTDTKGTVPPSIRSLKFLIPSLLLNKVKNYPKQLEDFLISVSPDILLPMSIMEGGSPR